MLPFPSNRECILYLTLPLIFSFNKANGSALSAQNFALAGLADKCRHLLNSADLHSLYNYSQLQNHLLSEQSKGVQPGRT